MPSKLHKQKCARRAAYIANSDKVRAQRSLRYYSDIERERERARQYSQASYNALSRVKRGERKAQMLALSMHASPTKKKRASSKAAYDASPTKKRAQMRAHSKSAYAASPTKSKRAQFAAF